MNNLEAYKRKLKLINFEIFLLHRRVKKNCVTNLTEFSMNETPMAHILQKLTWRCCHLCFW